MVTKNQIKEKVLQMIPDVAINMTKNLGIVISECESVIRLEDFDNDYVLPKLILQALLKEEIFQYQATYITKSKCVKNTDKLVEKLYALI